MKTKYDISFFYLKRAIYKKLTNVNLFKIHLWKGPAFRMLKISSRLLKVEKTGRFPKISS